MNTHRIKKIKKNKNNLQGNWTKLFLLIERKVKLHKLKNLIPHCFPDPMVLLKKVKHWVGKALRWFFFNFLKKVKKHHDIERN